MLDEMTLQNASKFAIFLEYENLCTSFLFFIVRYFIFFPNECSGLGRQDHGRIGEKNKVARYEK